MLLVVDEENADDTVVFVKASPTVIPLRNAKLQTIYYINNLK